MQLGNQKCHRFLTKISQYLFILLFHLCRWEFSVVDWTLQVSSVILSFSISFCYLLPTFHSTELQTTQWILLWKLWWWIFLVELELFIILSYEPFIKEKELALATSWSAAEEIQHIMGIQHIQSSYFSNYWCYAVQNGLECTVLVRVF